jgi:putative membrane protein
MGNLFKDFKRCFKFLLPIGLGVIVGVVFGLFVVKGLVDAFPFAVICLFSGLMLGAFPAVKTELKGAKLTPLRVALFGVGVLIPVAIGVVSAWVYARTPMPLSDYSLRYGETYNQFSGFNYRMFLTLPVGYLLGITQIVPGLSASALLMSLGWFNDLVHSVSLTFWLENPIVFVYYLTLGAGFIAGLLTFSKILSILFKKMRQATYFVIVGLSLGSILSMFFNGDVLTVYLSWQGGANYLEIAMGVLLFALGTVASYLLVRYQRKKDREE